MSDDEASVVEALSAPACGLTSSIFCAERVVEEGGIVKMKETRESER